MKATLGLAVFMIALVVSGCGGGGGGSGSSATPTSTTPTAPVTASVETLQGLTLSPTALSGGIVVPFSGALDPTKTTVDLTVGGVHVAGTVSFSNNNQNVTFTPTVRLPFGKSVTETITGVDTFGRVVQTTVSFTTSAMVCADNAIWSNPAVFSAAFEDCVAPIGVQAIVTSLNVMTDNSCIITVGTPLSSLCRAYMANGTMLLADTPMVVNDHAATWMAYVGTDVSSNIVLLDTNNPNNPVPVGKLVLPGTLIWEIGNPGGLGTSIRVNNANKNEEVSWNGSALTLTCLIGCP